MTPGARHGGHGLGCQRRRGQGPGRGVDQASGQVDALTDHLRPGGRRLEALGGAHQDRQLHGGGTGGLPGGLARVPVGADVRPKASCLHRAGGVASGQGNGDRPRRGGPKGGPSCPAQGLLRVGLGKVAEPGGHHWGQPEGLAGQAQDLVGPAGRADGGSGHRQCRLLLGGQRWGCCDQRSVGALRDADDQQVDTAQGRAQGEGGVRHGSHRIGWSRAAAGGSANLAPVRVGCRPLGIGSCSGNATSRSLPSKGAPADRVFRRERARGWRWALSAMPGST